MHHFRKQLNLFHNSLAVHQYELFSFYKSINLKINILLLYILQNYYKTQKYCLADVQNICMITHNKEKDKKIKR